MPANSPRRLRLREVADNLGVKPDVVLAWVHSGELVASNVAQKAGGRPRWRVDPADLEAFLARRRNGVKTPPTKRRRQPTEAAPVIEFF